MLSAVSRTRLKDKGIAAQKNVERSKTMNDTSSHNAGSIEAKVTKIGAAIGERVQSATAATAAVAGQARKIASGAAAATTAVASQASKGLGAASETAEQAWSQAGAVAEDVVDVGRRATRSISRQIHENPLMAVMAGFALGYLAAVCIRRTGARAARDLHHNPEGKLHDSKV
jgi:hypothetical protein